jgi:hypothetical protein
MTQGFVGPYNVLLDHIYEWDEKHHRYIPGKFAILRRPLVYIDSEDAEHRAPIGTKTDGGSIPRRLWAVICSPFTEALPAFVIHDHEWAEARKIEDAKERKFARKKADLTFREILRYIGIREWKCRAMYWGVRIGAQWEEISRR